MKNSEKLQINTVEESQGERAIEKYNGYLEQVPESEIQSEESTIMSKAMRIVGFVVWMLHYINVVLCQTNNVCPSYRDYETIKTNKKCWYDPAADSTAVSNKLILLSSHRQLQFIFPAGNNQQKRLSRCGIQSNYEGWLYHHDV